VNSLQSWLTTSIPGIVLLGAAGSLLAVFIQRRVGQLVTKHQDAVYQATGKFVLWWLGLKPLEFMDHSIRTPGYELMTMLAGELAKLVTLPWVATFAVRSVSWSQPFPQDPPIANIAAVAVSLFCLYEILRSLLRISLHKRFSADPEFQAMAREVIDATGTSRGSGEG